MSQGVSVSEATMQFFVEAMRDNTNVLENVGKTMQGLQAEQKEHLHLIIDVRERVIRIEAVPQVSKEIGELRGKVEMLEKAGVAADTKAATLNWLLRYVPLIFGMVVSLIAGTMIVLAANGQLSPQTPLGDRFQANVPAPVEQQPIARQ